MTSTNSKVKCTSTAGQFYFNQFQNVHVSGMTFQGCNSALRMNRVSRANVTDCHFEGNRATNGRYTAGSCLFVEQSSVTISDSNFQNNIANYLGGAVYAVGSTITVSSSMNTVVPSLEGPAQTSMEGFSTRTFMHQIISSEEVSSVTTQAGDDGGVMSIGRLNCFVSIDESLFDFNYAADRGGVIALIASSLFMEINRTNIYNNTAEFGGVMSACNSQVTLLDDSLVVTVDPLLSFLYTL